MVAITANEERNEVFQLCVACYANSINRTVVNGWCSSCGASGALDMPRWAIELIDSNKKMEMKETAKKNRELAYLRTLLPDVVLGRSIKLIEPGKYWVSQFIEGTTVTVMVNAPNAKAALLAAKPLLPYYPDVE